MNTITRIADRVLGHKETAIPIKPKVDESRPMQALVWRGPNRIEYETVPRPCITDPADIILKVTATSICGSDLHLYDNTMPGMQPGDILGHEFMGLVEEVGEKVEKLHVGQRVVVAFDIACGQCDYCKREEYTACDVTNPSKVQEYLYGHRTAGLFGYSHLTGGVPGGQSEYVRVPFADVNCLPIPDEVPDDKALYLSDVVPTALFGVDRGEVKEGSTVAIWGLGPIGLMAARWCQIRKAGKIIGIDYVPDRLEIAREELKIETINFKEQDVCKTIAELVPGGVDVCLECAGFEYATTLLHKVEMALKLETDTSDIFLEMCTAVRKFGTISVLGVYTGFTNHFPIGALMEKGLSMRCGQSPTQKYWRYALEKIQSGEMDPTIMVTHRTSLVEGPKLYELFQKKEGVIKVFMRPASLSQSSE